MKRILLLYLMLVFAVFGLTGCGKYPSHYKAVMHVHSNDSDSGWTSFHEFEGTESFKLKCESRNSPKIRYSGKLEAGSLTVYCGCGGTKQKLFSLSSGEEVNGCSETLSADTAYVILETSEKCQDGSLSFEIVYD